MRLRSASWLRPLLALSLAGSLGCAPAPVAPSPAPAAEEGPSAAGPPAPAAPAAPVVGAIAFTGQATLAGQPMAGATIEVFDPVTGQPLPVGAASEGRAYLVAAPAAATAEGGYEVQVAGLPSGRAVLIVAKSETHSVSGVFLGPPSAPASYTLQATGDAGRLDEVSSLNARLAESLLITAHLLTPAAAEPGLRTALDKMSSYRVAMGAALVFQPEILKMVTSLDSVLDRRRGEPQGVADMLGNGELRRSMAQLVINNLRTVAEALRVNAFRATSIEDVRDLVTRVHYPGTDMVGRVNFDTWTITLENPRTGRKVDMTNNPDAADRVAPPGTSGGDDGPSTPTPTPTPVPPPTVTTAQLEAINDRVYEAILVDEGQDPATWDAAATSAVEVSLNRVDDVYHLGAVYTAESLRRYFHFDLDGLMVRATDLYDPAGPGDPPYELVTLTPASGAGSQNGNVTLADATLVMNVSALDIEPQTFYFDDTGLLAMIMPAAGGKSRVVRWTGALKPVIN